MTDKDKEMLQRLNALKKIEDDPDLVPAAIRTIALRTLQHVRDIVQ